MHLLLSILCADPPVPRLYCLPNNNLVEGSLYASVALPQLSADQQAAECARRCQVRVPISTAPFALVCHPKRMAVGIRIRVVLHKLLG